MLHPKIFDKDVEMKATRAGMSEGLLEAGAENAAVVALSADLAESVKVDAFAKKYPERYFEMGICEQSMASVASGLAAMGKIPFIASYAVFSPGRNWEQIRTNICYNDSNVKIIGGHSGVTVGEDGGTHQALEDIALTRVLPNMTVIVPCDANEAKAATVAAARTKKPVYLRMTRGNTPVMTSSDSSFEIGKSSVLWKPEGNSQAGIIACGPVAYNALLAAKRLFDSEKIAVSVLNLSTIKPLDEEGILAFAAESGGKIVTVEEHQAFGGMGSAVAELFAKKRPTPVEFVAVSDRFGQSGKPEELIEKYGLGIDAVISAIRRVLSR